MKTSEAYEVGRIFEFLTGITTAGAVATNGKVKTDLAEFPNLKGNMPLERYSVMTVVEKVKRLQALLSDNDFPATTKAMEELRNGLKEMEEYLEENPSTTSFLRDPFAENLVTNAREVDEQFRAELDSK